MASNKLSNHEKQTLINLIELYRDMPYLWDKNDKNYMTKSVREEGYKVLLSIYKNIEQNATLKTLKKKLDNMRSNFYKELKKVKSSKHTGAGNDDVYTPTVWYYDHFKFLESSTNPCRSVADTMDMDQDSSCEEESLPKTVISGNTSFKKRKRESSYDTQKTILEKATKLMDSKEMDWEILGKCIGMQLRDLDPRQQTIARKLISDIIFYGTLNKLTEDWFVGGVPIHNPANIVNTVNSSRIQNPANMVNSSLIQNPANIVNTVNSSRIQNPANMVNSSLIQNPANIVNSNPIQNSANMVNSSPIQNSANIVNTVNSRLIQNPANIVNTVYTVNSNPVQNPAYTVNSSPIQNPANTVYTVNSNPIQNPAYTVNSSPIQNPANTVYTVNSNPVQNPANIVNTFNPVSSPETPESEPSLIYNVIQDPENPEFYQLHITDERQIITEGKADVMKEFLLIKKERK